MLNKIAGIPFDDWETQTIPNSNIAGDPLASVFNVVLQYIFPIAGFVLLFYLVTSGYSYMTSMGDPKKIEAAKTNITYAIVGFVVIFVAYWIVIFSGQALGLNAIGNIF